MTVYICTLSHSYILTIMDLRVQPSAATIFQNSASEFLLDGIGGRGGSRGGGGDIRLTPPNVSSMFSNASPTEIGLATNQSVPYHFSMKELGSNRLGPGAIVFGMSCAAARTFGEQCPDKSIMATDFRGANTWLSENSEKIIRMGCDVQSLFRIYGAVKVKAASTSSRFQSMGTSVVNNVVGQRANVANVWGPEAHPGTQLFFVLKKTKNGHWKFSPYGDQAHATPPLDSVEDGACFFVGTAMSSPMTSIEGVYTAHTSTFVGGLDVCMGI
jgi:hypothetical protein